MEAVDSVGDPQGCGEVEQRMEHDYREVGGRVTPGAVTELPEQRPRSPKRPDGPSRRPAFRDTRTSLYIARMRKSGFGLHKGRINLNPRHLGLLSRVLTIVHFVGSGKLHSGPHNVNMRHNQNL